MELKKNRTKPSLCPKKAVSFTTPAMLLAASLTLPRPDTFGMQPARSSGHSVWAVGANLTCSQCERVVSNIEGYCSKQRPMGDLDLSCFDCTWAHQEMPGCQRIMALIKARPQPIPEPTVRGDGVWLLDSVAWSFDTYTEAHRAG